jgi:CubicO group peptidase (beta-lactamase class C family)
MHRAFILSAALLFAQACSAEPDVASTAPAVTEFLDTEIREQRLRGAVAMVVGDRRILYGRAFGHRDNAAADPMQRDDLFRLYSMTKPITATAALILVDEGRLDLDAPIDLYLPEFASPRAYQEPSATGARAAAPAQRAPTVRELLIHTAGFTYGQGGAENESDYRAAGLLPEIWSARNRMLGRTNADVSHALSEIPLAFEPGTAWAYGRSTDVLGRIVEVVSGQSLEAFMRARIFDPLQMRDTSFNVPAANLARVAEPSTLTAEGEPNVHMSDLSLEQTFQSGGGGLVGTADDYARFCQMLLNGGELGGVRILSERAVEQMFTDQLGALAGHPGFGFNERYGFTFAGFVRSVETTNGERSEIGWWGAGGTAFWCDRTAKLCGILMIQQADEARRFSDRFHDLARDAFD